MNKVSVGRSIARAYGFLFGRIFTIAGLSWVGVLFYAALSFVLLQRMGAMPAEAVRAAAMAGHPQAALFHLAIALSGLLIVAGIAVSLSRAALGEGGGFKIAHFTIGGRELRYFLAMLRLYVLVIVLAAAGAFAVKYMPAGVEMATVQLPQLAQWPVLHAAHIAVAALTAVLILFAMLRFGFLLIPVAAVEEHASLARAWSLSGGNTWRILAVMLAVLLPAYALLFAGEYALLGQPLLDAYRGLFAAWPNGRGAVLQFYMGHGGIFAAGAGVKLALVLSLLTGAGAAAYRTLTGADESAMEMSGMADRGHDMQGHDDRGHDVHGHEEHGHDMHGHDANGHDDHGHDAHGHDDHGHNGHEIHGHEDHGHDAHGHEEHGHDDHGHAHHAAPAQAAETYAEEQPAYSHEEESVPAHEEERTLEHA